jgi:hypothetical protein
MKKAKKFSRVLHTLGGVSGGGLHPPYAFGGAASCEAPGRGFLVLFSKKNILPSVSLSSKVNNPATDLSPARAGRLIDHRRET